jgi:hypothetical protein
MHTPFKPPLTIYVLWHPAYADGALLAQKLFKVFTRNVDDPFARTPGIPVYFRSAPATREANAPREIVFEESDHTAIVILVDDRMVVGDAWQDYVAGLARAASASAGKVRLFPVAVNSNSFNFPIADTNFIRLYEVRDKGPTPPAVAAASPGVETRIPSGKDAGITINIFINGEQADSRRVATAVVETAPPVTALATGTPPPAGAGAGPAVGAAEVMLLERKATFLIGKLAHELSRLLYHRPRVTEAGTEQSPPAIKMFISHAKADGADVAREIRDHIHADTSLKSFFDANDIAAGFRFSNELLAALEESAVICVQSDVYATREWCLWEVINAKRLDRPVVVVNAVTDREYRSFPYLGNVPTIRWRFGQEDNGAQIEGVLDAALFEVLGTRFRELLHRELIKTFDLPETTGVVGHPPELFTILKLAAERRQQGQAQEEACYVVYPDPPLGDEELRLLGDLAPHIRFVTPTMLPLVRHLTNCQLK